MNEKEKYFIDLSKLSEDKQKHIISFLQYNEITAQIFYMIRNSDWGVLEVFSHLFFNEQNVWQLCSKRSTETNGKQELTYPDFIKLFEGGKGENNGWISIEKGWPKEEGEYLTYQKSSDSMSVNYCDTEQWGYYHAPDEVPTYWMRLPEPPKF